MNAFDAVFLALAAGIFIDRRSPTRWLAALVPLVACALDLAPLGRLHAPLAALAALALAPRAAPVALLLALPQYASFGEALRAALTFPAAVVLFEAVETRLKEDSIPARWRGAPIRLVVCAALYYTLLPVAYL